jgi:hypothetical protein
MVRHLCRMNGIPHDMWCLWADTFCAYDFGVSYWSNNGYGDWIFGVEGCYLSQVDESQQNAGLWIGGTYVESLAWRNYMTEFTLSATARYDFNWNGEDDYIVTQMDNHASVYVRAYQASETQKSTISGGYEIAFLFWTGEVVVFGNDCDWATIRYNVSDIITYQQEYKIGVDLKDEAMKIYIDGHHTISYNMSAVNCLAGSIGFKTFYSDLEVRNLTVANSSTPILGGLGLAGW